MTRRGFLLGACAFAVLASMPGVANAAPSRTIVLESVKDANGVHQTLRMPSGVAAELGELRSQELIRASNRALSIAQSQNLSIAKGNGLLTRIWKPALKASPKGIVTTLLEASLVLGFAWALTNASAELTTGSSTLTMTGKDCASTPVSPGQMWDRGTGIYRTSATSNTAFAVQRTTATTAGGTVPAPSGWSWAGQRLISGSTNTVEVQFTKTIACGERIAFPPTVPGGAIPVADQGGNQVDINSAQNQTKIVDGNHGAAVADQAAGLPMPGGEIPGQVEEPGITIPAAASVPAGPIGAQTPYTPIDYTTPRPAIGADDTHVQFPVGALPTTPGTETPTPTPTPTPGVPADEVTEPGAVAELPAFESFATPFKNLFTPFTEALTPAPASCPSLQMPSVTVYDGKGLVATSFNYHCQLIGPFEGVIRTVSIAYGGWVGVKNAMDA